jgi:hypothetical protein
MVDKLNQSEHGQNLVLFAVIMVVLVALAALVIDGGFAYTKRREAQNAADAGALAGANALCAGNPGLAEPQALDYAINRNGATAAEVIQSTKVITVTTTIPHQTFLAGIFGTEVVTTTATASAGCYTPCSGTGVLPVAWSCRAPAGDPIDPQTCEIQYGTSAVPGPLYVIMDSIKSSDEFLCQDPITHLPVGAMNCDLNNDGVNELFGGAGNRGWLNLDGGSGSASEMKGWVENHGYVGEVFIHTWFGGSNGDKTSVFKAVQDYLIDDIVLLPVFDAYCDGTPDTACPGLYHSGQDSIVPGSGGGFNYHVISFSAFKITCVSTKKQDICPGKSAAIALNPDIKDNTKTIEGYFVKDYFGSGKCDGPSSGVYTIYLNH